MGGEKAFPTFWSLKNSGSPPRGRGKVSKGIKPSDERGITPAWAGKSMTAPGRSSRTGDHPRVGGEKNNHIIDNQYGKGSPPRGRGKAPTWSSPIYRTRITPAWAGKSFHPAGRWQTVRDHPRMGGEKFRTASVRATRSGSPPHGRGKGLRQLSGVAHHRSTPAWAGKSIRCTSTTRLIRDHPRMGGEKMTRRYSSVPVPGSPLRGRGKAFRVGLAGRILGITPA